MEVTKRRRGRPKGSCMDDRKYLTEVAAILAKEPKKKKSRAIVQVAESNFSKNQRPAAERRLQRKWKASGQQLLIAERERRIEERKNLSNQRFVPTNSIFHQVAEDIRAAHDSIFPKSTDFLEMQSLFAIIKEINQPISKLKKIMEEVQAPLRIFQEYSQPSIFGELVEAQHTMQQAILGLR